MDVTKLRAMISRPCENAFRVPYTTRKYADVLKWWSFYKQGKLSRDITLLNSIFSFRRQSSDHVILYSSSAIPESVLLLGKVNGKYININLPMGIENERSSFVAVYV